MRLHELTPAKGSKKKPKRLGKGPGTGQGKTAGRGSKGFNSRSGGGVRPGYEGGQMPIHRRLPKRGFTNIFKKQYAIINLEDLARFEPGTIVDASAMIKTGLVKGRWDGIKLLGDGEINSSFTIKVNKASKRAIEKIEAAGGTVEQIA